MSDGTPRHHFLPPNYRVMLAGNCGLILTLGLARFAYTPMLPIMQGQGVLTTISGGWLAGINYAGYMAAALIVAGGLANHISRRTLYRVGLAAAVLSTTAMGLTQSMPVWILLRFVAGLGSAAGMLLGSGLVLNWLAQHGHRPQLGVYFTGMGLGIAVSGWIVAATAGWLNWAQQWLAMGALGAALALPAWIWIPSDGTIAPPTVTTTSPRPLPNLPWQLVAAYCAAGAGYVVSATFLVAIVKQQPVLSASGNAIWIAVGAAAALACAVWDRLALRIGQGPTLILAYIAQIASIVLAAFGRDLASALIGAILFGATFIGIVTLVLTLVGRRYPSQSSNAMARLTLSYGAAQIAAPMVAGYIAQATGDYQAVLYLAAAVMTIGTLLLAQLQLTEGIDPTRAATADDHAMV